MGNIQKYKRINYLEGIDYSKATKRDLCKLGAVHYLMNSNDSLGDDIEKRILEQFHSFEYFKHNVFLFVLNEQVVEFERNGKYPSYGYIKNCKKYDMIANGTPYHIEYFDFLSALNGQPKRKMLALFEDAIIESLQEKKFRMNFKEVAPHSLKKAAKWLNESSSILKGSRRNSLNYLKENASNEHIFSNIFFEFAAFENLESVIVENSLRFKKERKLLSDKEIKNQFGFYCVPKFKEDSITLEAKRRAYYSSGFDDKVAKVLHEKEKKGIEKRKEAKKHNEKDSFSKKMDSRVIKEDFSSDELAIINGYFGSFHHFYYEGRINPQKTVIIKATNDIRRRFKNSLPTASQIESKIKESYAVEYGKEISKRSFEADLDTSFGGLGGLFEFLKLDIINEARYISRTKKKEWENNLLTFPEAEKKIMLKIQKKYEFSDSGPSKIDLMIEGIDFSNQSGKMEKLCEIFNLKKCGKDVNVDKKIIKVMSYMKKEEATTKKLGANFSLLCKKHLGMTLVQAREKYAN